MTGYKIKLPKNTQIKADGKIVIPMHYRDASHKIRSRLSKKQKVVRRSI